MLFNSSSKSTVLVPDAFSTTAYDIEPGDSLPSQYIQEQHSDRSFYRLDLHFFF